MKKILFIRHAKSDWSSSMEIKDIDRSLNTRGVMSAHLMSKKMINIDLIPDVFLTSPACRALHTAEIFARTNNARNKIQISKNLYHPAIEDVFEELLLLEDKIQTAFVFFHNPAINEIGYKFINNFTENVPTCGILAFDINIEHWQDFNPNDMEFQFFDYPKKK